jgi:hypothetical protein
VSDERRRPRLPAIWVVLLAAAGVFVLVATVVDAVTQDSWAPVWMNAWVPAVLLASLYRPAAGKRCWLIMRGRIRP